MKKMVMLLALLPFVAVAQKPGIKDLFPNTPTPFVTDAAGILKPSDITALNDKARGVQGATGGDIAVATLSTIKDYQPYEVGTEIFRTWGVGGKASVGESKRNLGVVILLVPRTKEHKGSCYITTGNGAEGVITDSHAGTICRNAIPQLKAGDYAGGLMSMMNEIGPIFESTVRPPPPPAPSKPINWTPILAVLGIILFGGGVAFLIWRIRENARLEKERLATIAYNKKLAEERAVREAEDKERRRIEAIAKAKRDAEEAERRRIAVAKEAARWAALTPEQQAAELEAKRLAELERAKRQAEADRLAAIELKKRRAREAVEAEARRKRDAEEEERRARQRREESSRSSYYSSDYGSSSSSGGSSSDSFGGGGGSSGGGGGSDF